MEKTKAKPVLTETGNSDAESTGLTNAAQIARKLNNEDKEIDMSKFHKSNNSVPAASSAAIFYGRHPVAAAIANPRRQINKILCTAENAEEIRRLCTENRRTPGLVNIVDRKEIDRILPREAVHQGIAAYVRELENYTLEDICIMAGDRPDCHVLILDQVTDPQNIGAIIRSCVAFDTLALIMQDKNAPAETGAMAKASAGMIEHLPICRVTNLSRAVEQLKQSGFWTVGMDGYAETAIDKLKKGGRTAVIMGSEGKGMRRLVEEACDITVRLPISAKVESLNVSTAAAIALYEISKK